MEFKKYEILLDKGKISHKQSEEKVFTECEKFNKTQPIESDFDREIKKFLENEKNLIY